MPTTADVLAMSDTEYADHINTMGFDEPWPEIEEEDDFRDQRGQWATEEDDK